jgi:hypothetical protein
MSVKLLKTEVPISRDTIGLIARSTRDLVSKRGTPASIRRKAMKSACYAACSLSRRQGRTRWRGGPMGAPKSFHALFQRLGERAGMPFPIYPHMAPARLRLRTGERRTRHQGTSGLARPPEHPIPKSDGYKFV